MIEIRRWRFETLQRYYEMELCQDLFGEWVLIRYWGGKDNHHYGQKTQWVENIEAGFLEAGKTKKVRLKRGYHETILAE